VKATRYVSQLVGAEHVALGSDFDGAVTEPFDTTGLVQITDAMLEMGYSEREIRMIMGENVVRFLQKNLPER
jgi:membrane dipeptidase